MPLLVIVRHSHATLPVIDDVRMGQHLIYAVYNQCVWQGDYQIYGHIRCIYIQL